MLSFQRVCSSIVIQQTAVNNADHPPSNVVCHSSPSLRRCSRPSPDRMPSNQPCRMLHRLHSVKALLPRWTHRCRISGNHRFSLLPPHSTGIPSEIRNQTSFFACEQVECAAYCSLLSYKHQAVEYVAVWIRGCVRGFMGNVRGLVFGGSRHFALIFIAR